MDLLQNVHIGLKSQEKESICQGPYAYYHYLCDGVDDRGWGCGYRTLQTLCSWLWLNAAKTDDKSPPAVPTIADIQAALVGMEDKPVTFKGSKQWIGSFEVCLCLDYFYQVPCKIIHIPKGSDVQQHLEELRGHFESVGSPVMMGGETDTASKGIMGVRLDDPALLVVDPHYSGTATSSSELQHSGYVKWMPLEELHPDSFYNLCLPKCKLKS